MPPALLEVSVARRLAGEPLEYVLGWAEFAGVRVRVRPPVFVPRAGAEPLVELAAVELVRRGGRGVVVDVGCGSGAIAAAVAAKAPRATVLGTDTDADAVTCARDNGIRAYRGNWLHALSSPWQGRVDVAVAHLPYVPTDALDQLARDYREAESVLALDGGADGLDPLRQVLAQLSRWLSPGGVLLTLTADAQTQAVRRVLSQAGRSGQVCDGPWAGSGSTLWRVW